MPSVDQVVVWIVIGVLAGTLVGRLVTWKKEGLGLCRNLGLGLAGALIGGLLIRAMGLFPFLDSVSISLRDIVAAVAGSFLVLGVYWFVMRGAR
jgi:uncharacterized membrane protein YeaQ/YmgE (transglycosylase-associated protein family)